MEKFRAASASIPLLYAANTSKLVNIMNRLLEIVTQAVGDEADIEILEMHDQWKKDAPQRDLPGRWARSWPAPWEKSWRISPSTGATAPAPGRRAPSANHSLRAGNIPSSHTVYFGFMGERLEITHHSYNWECFARGAVDCAAYLADKGPGWYTHPGCAAPGVK